MNEKILLIAPYFFGYGEKIYKALLRKGYKVRFISESVNQLNLFFRVMTSHYFSKSLLTRTLVKRYYQKRVTRDNDYVLVVRGGQIPQYILEMVKADNPNAKFIFYQWDSISLNPNGKKLLSLFDEILTSEFQDAEQYGWVYLPLFFTTKGSKKNERRYDITFIGSMNSKRAEIVRRIKEFGKSNPNLHIFTYLYTPYLSYFVQKYLKKDKYYRDTKRSEFEFKKMPLNEVNKIYADTRVMIDYTAQGETGYNERTVESLACGYKLVTNNSYVKTADFYNPNNIWIYTDDDFGIPDWFLNTEYQEVPPQICENYSIDRWIDTILHVNAEERKQNE